MFISILGGLFKGQKVFVPNQKSTRPITSILRKSLFDILGPQIEGTSFLDLFAGSGIMGIEAISRGATSGVFVENSTKAIGAIEKTRKKLSLEDKTFLAKKDAFSFCKHYKKDPFDFIFIDPPYSFEKDTLQDLFTLIWENSCLHHKETLLIYKKAKESEALSLDFLHTKKERSLGSNTLIFYTFN